MADLILSPKDIVNKEFQTKWHGYDPNEVDEFLDQVIKDYETAKSEIASLKSELAMLKEQVKEAPKHTANSVDKPAANTYHVEAPVTSVTNFDILKRLSNLEKEVFGKKLQEDTLEDTLPIETPDTISYSEEENDLEKTKQF